MDKKLKTTKIFALFPLHLFKKKKFILGIKIKLKKKLIDVAWVASWRYKGTRAHL